MERTLFTHTTPLLFNTKVLKTLDFLEKGSKIKEKGEKTPKRFQKETKLRNNVSKGNEMKEKDNPSPKNLRVLECFGGIGATTAALKNLNVDFEVVDYIEIDKYAVRSYNAINETDFAPQDIREWDKNLSADLLVHGSPCQDFSIAGQNAGGDEGSGTRSSLMWETVRIINKLRPKYVIWENVKGVLHESNYPTYLKYLNTMKTLGYTNRTKILNAKFHGVPQNRERLFVVSILGDHEFDYPPVTPIGETRLKSILESEVDERFYLPKDTLMELLPERPDKDGIRVIGRLLIRGNDCIRRVYSTEGLAPTLSTMQGGNRQPKILTERGIRKLTPRECWRLMGRTDADFEKAAKVCSNTQLYKQAGNSIVVPVMERMLKQLLKGERQC